MKRESTQINIPRIYPLIKTKDTYNIYRIANYYSFLES